MVWGRVRVAQGRTETVCTGRRYPLAHRRVVQHAAAGGADSVDDILQRQSNPWPLWTVIAANGADRIASTGKPCRRAGRIMHAAWRDTSQHAAQHVPTHRAACGCMSCTQRNTPGASCAPTARHGCNVLQLADNGAAHPIGVWPYAVTLAYPVVLNQCYDMAPHRAVLYRGT